MDEFLSKILEILKELNIKPTIYGSFGVANYLGDFKSFEDLDILIEDEFVNDRWKEFKKLFSLQLLFLLPMQSLSFLMLLLLKVS